ncbi:hypothetical protein LV178_28095, partial [Burkholderia mallei]|nr:hypothetical protein [Burkholderia mallei]
RTRNPDPRKTKPHAHKNVGFVSSLRRSANAAFSSSVGMAALCGCTSAKRTTNQAINISFEIYLACY